MTWHLKLLLVKTTKMLSKQDNDMTSDTVDSKDKSDSSARQDDRNAAKKDEWTWIRQRAWFGEKANFARRVVPTISTRQKFKPLYSDWTGQRQIWLFISSLKSYNVSHHTVYSYFIIRSTFSLLFSEEYSSVMFVHFCYFFQKSATSLNISG